MKLNVGYNFDRELLEGLKAMNAAPSNRVKVEEVFGSVRGVPLGSARPSFRLPEAGVGDVMQQVKQLREAGIEFNWTINASFVDTRKLKSAQNQIAAFFLELRVAGVRRVIVSHPLVAKLAQEAGMKLEISTIVQVRSERTLEQWKERFPSIDKICMDVFINRDWPKLHELCSRAHELEMEVELLANEFCIHECIDRNTCYDLHSLDVGRDDVKLFSHYPMGNCMRKRITEPIEWLRARFILPQWMQLYEDEFGIDTFKISGRTHSTAYILWVTSQYMQQDYQGNLLELWADVENIGRAHEEYRKPRVEIDCSRISQRFLDLYRRHVMPLDPDLEQRALETAYAEATR